MMVKTRMIAHVLNTDYISFTASCFLFLVCTFTLLEPLPLFMWTVISVSRISADMKCMICNFLTAETSKLVCALCESTLVGILYLCLVLLLL